MTPLLIAAAAAVFLAAIGSGAYAFYAYAKMKNVHDEQQAGRFVTAAILAILTCGIGQALAGLLTALALSQ